MKQNINIINNIFNLKVDTLVFIILLIICILCVKIIFNFFIKKYRNNENMQIMLNEQEVLINKEDKIYNLPSQSITNVFSLPITPEKSLNNTNNGQSIIVNKIEIPLNLYQTWYTKKLPPKMKECVESLKKDNPEFNYYLYDDKDCEKFIKNNFDKKVLNAYKTLIPGAYKADLWRYCILYINGGIYLDIKYKCVDGFKLIELTDKEYFCLDKPFIYINKESEIKNNYSYINKIMRNPDFLINFEKYTNEFWGKGSVDLYNGIMVCKKNNNILLNCINKIVENVENKFYGNSSLEPTGPSLLANQYFNIYPRIYKGFHLCYGVNDKTIFNFKKKKVILEHYYEYRKEQQELTNKKHYGELWSIRKIYK